MVSPEEAVKEYAEDRLSGDAAIPNYRSRLKPFIEFCRDASLERMALLNSRTIRLYKQNLVADTDIGAATLEQRLRTLRDFLSWYGMREGAVEAASINSVVVR